MKQNKVICWQEYIWTNTQKLSSDGLKLKSYYRIIKTSVH